MVSLLASRVTEALRNAIDGLQADPRPLAVGLLGVLGQLPLVFRLEENARHRDELRQMTSPRSRQLWVCTRRSRPVTTMCETAALVSHSARAELDGPRPASVPL
jgi:hypothetical protein